MNNKARYTLIRRIRLLVAGLLLGALLLVPGPALALPYAVGDVFAGVGAGKVNVYSSTGVFKQTLDTTTASSEQTGMCFDASGNLYTTDWTAGKVSKFDNAGNLLDADWGGPFSTHPETCVVDNSGNIYVGEVDGANMIRKFDSSGTLLDSFSPAGESRGTDWMDLAADQCTMFYTSEGSHVKRFDVCTDSQLADFASGLSSPCYALRIRANSEVMVACSSAVYRLSAAGAVLQTYTLAEIGVTDSCGLFAMNLDPDGASFWTGSYCLGQIRRVNIDTEAVITSFTAAPLGFSMAGLAIFGEITQGCPTCSQVPEFGIAASLLTALAALPIIGIKRLYAKRN